MNDEVSIIIAMRTGEDGVVCYAAEITTHRELFTSGSDEAYTLATELFFTDRHRWYVSPEDVLHYAATLISDERRRGRTVNKHCVRILIEGTKVYPLSKTWRRLEKVREYI